jgi:MoaF C-terminal domain/MoaF N-terminal domain
MSSDSVHEQGYVPVEAWPNLTAMVESFGDPALPRTDALAGREITLQFDDGRSVAYEFIDLGSVRRHGGRVEAYTAIEARPGIYLVDVLGGEGRAAENVTIALDLESGRATVATSTLFDREGETRARTDFAHASVGDAVAAPHPPSTGLVGKRIHYRYSERDHYEHIYLNSGTFTWHCIRGAEQGLADTEQTRTWEVAEDLFLFYWTEAVMPVEAVLLVDLRHMRSLGRMFGWDPAPDELVHLPFSSRATLLNETTYPEGSG